MSVAIRPLSNPPADLGGHRHRVLRATLARAIDPTVATIVDETIAHVRALGEQLDILLTRLDRLEARQRAATTLTDRLALDQERRRLLVAVNDRWRGLSALHKRLGLEVRA